MVPSDVLKPFFSLRAAAPARVRSRSRRAELKGSTSEWRIENRSITDPSGRVIPLIRHGLDRYSALQALPGATVVRGDFPQVTDVTTESRTVQSLIEQVSPSGDLLNVYASLYGDRTRTVLLLDYLH